MEFDEILKSAIEKCKSNKSEGYPDFDKLYPFTTENISGYLDNFDLKDKTLLTVGSSLDQVLNASLNGCNNIDVIDCNKYIKYYYYLKKALILTKSRMDYIKFLSYENNPKNFECNYNTFNSNTFNYIKDTLKELDYESYTFFNELYKKFIPLEIRKHLFTNDEYNYKINIILNRYLKDDNTYNTLKENIINTKVTFQNKDIYKDNINNMYDNIWLSNILSYASQKDTIKVLNKFKEYLNKDGKLLLSYLYETPTRALDDDFPDIYKKDNYNSLINDYNMDMISFIGVRGVIHNIDTIKDSILVYKKKD